MRIIDYRSRAIEWHCGTLRTNYASVIVKRDAIKYLHSRRGSQIETRAGFYSSIFCHVYGHFWDVACIAPPPPVVRIKVPRTSFTQFFILTSLVNFYFHGKQKSLTIR